MNKNSSPQPNARPGGASGVHTARRTARIFAITGGKKGVGKTNVSANLGIALALRGAKVCIVDGDGQRSNISALLNLHSGFSLEDFINGYKTLDEVVRHGPSGVHVIPAPNLSKQARYNANQAKRLISAFEALEKRYDYVLIDTGSGINDSVYSFIQSAQYAIVVISPEPASLTDAFALIKGLKKKDFDRPVHVLINMAQNYDNSLQVFRRFETGVHKFLQKKVLFLGYISLDETVSSSVRLQQAVLTLKPDAPSSRCFYSLATAVENQFSEDTEEHTLSNFWRRAIENSVAPPLHALGAPVDGTAQQTQTTRSQSAPQLPAPQVNRMDAIPRQKEPVPMSNRTNPVAATLPAAAPRQELESFADLSRVAVALVNRGEESDGAAAAFIKSFIDAYVKKHKKFPFDVRTVLYRSLDLQDYPPADIRDLFVTIESLYEKHHNEPVRSMDETVLKLLTELRGQEDKLLQLHQRVTESYQRQYNKDLDDPVEIVKRQLSGHELDHQRYTQLFDYLKLAYQEHFGAPYVDKTDQQNQAAQVISQRMIEHEQVCRQRMQMLLQSLQESSALHADLQGLFDEAASSCEAPPQIGEIPTNPDYSDHNR